ncbi:hypothetical protein ACMD2_06919, partial [Ananas comosus]
GLVSWCWQSWKRVGFLGVLSGKGSAEQGLCAIGTKNNLVEHQIKLISEVWGREIPLGSFKS